MTVMCQQLELFEDNDEVSFLKRKISLLENTIENLRKSLFARHGELKNDIKFLEEIVLDFHHRLSALEDRK